MNDDSKYSFKNLELWKSAHALAIEVCRLCDDLPAKRSADVIARQLIRSATSVQANIAEGHGRFSLPAYLNHLSIAKGSATESQGWILALGELDLIAPDAVTRFDSRFDTLIAAITRRILSLEARIKSRQIREEGPYYDADSEEVPRFEGSQVRAGGEEEVVP